MRQCPSCNRTYDDDSLSFCLEDGSPLSDVYDRQATLVGVTLLENSPTQKARSDETPRRRAQPSRQSKSAKRKRKSQTAKVKNVWDTGQEAKATAAAIPPTAARNKKWTQPESQPNTESARRMWLLASVLILAAAAALRLYAYDMKPFHHDEGVNGFFLIDLFRKGTYSYNPANYHGPTLYYFSLATSLIFGLNDFAVRLVPALFGVGTVWLMLSLRKYIGTFGALTAAALVAVSPAAVFYSRYFIHESPFVFFSVAIVVASLRYYETAKPIYLMLAAASAALLFGTKETAMITAGVFIIAVASTEIYQRMRGTRAAPKRRERSIRSKHLPPIEPQGGIKGALARFGSMQDIAWLAAAALVLFIFIHVLFYSSFFTHSQGISDSLATFKVWVRTGTSEFHAKPFETYLGWLWQEEAALLLLGLAGAALALWRATNRFAVFSALWTIGIIAAYSLVPYKTPWLVLSFIPPLAIMGGYAVNALYELEDNTRLRSFALGVCMLAVALGAFQTVMLNFYNYDNEQYIYVYAHTQRGYLSLIEEINDAARRAGTKEGTTIAINSPDYWPMPWYLREYKGVAYAGRVGTNSEQIVVCSQNQAQECEVSLAGRYRRINSYPLRPGVTLILYERNDVPPR